MNSTPKASRAIRKAIRGKASRLCLLLAFGFCIGCGKSEDPASAGAAAAQAAGPPSEQEKQIEAQFIPPPNAKPDAPAIERLNGAVHPGLTMLLQGFIQAKGRMPESIYELANATVDSLPPVPYGMKYEIDRSDKTVKLVRK